MKALCGHSYDLFCLGSLVEQAAIDEALYPPRCCKLPIPPEAFKALIPTEIWENFEKRSIEWTTPAKDRRYCPWPMCSEFLGSAQTLDREVACPACHSLLCTYCQEPAHPWDTSCDRKDDSTMIEHMLQENSWQRCPGCGVIVELSFGCNHMTCRCGAEFCYECGAGWKSCGCEVWNQQKLYAEAERRLNEEEEEWKLNPQQGISPLVRDLGNLRVYVPPAQRRQARIEALADYLRNNHPCDHNWQQNMRSGCCGECGKSVETSLMVCVLLGRLKKLRTEVTYRGVIGAISLSVHGVLSIVRKIRLNDSETGLGGVLWTTWLRIDLHYDLCSRLSWYGKTLGSPSRMIKS